MTRASVFIFRMAWRETRASWKRLLFFFICIAVGVGSIVALRSVIQGVREALSREARSLLAADVLLSSNRAWTPAVLEAVEKARAAGQVREQTDAIEMPTLVRPAGGGELAKMVELRAVGPEFPLYGTITLEDGGRYSHRLLRGRGALVRPELLVQLDVAVGDQIVIGTQPFTIRGLIATEPGRQLGVFSLGPRVLIDAADLPATGLLTYGTRANHQLQFRVPEAQVEPLAAELRQALANEFVSVRSYRRSENQVGDDLARAENYLSLVGLVIVILGGIGVSSVTRVFVEQKIRSIAILKCLGSTSRQMLAVYVLQVLVLGLAGSVLGIGLAAAAVAALPGFVASFGPTLGAADYGLTVPAVVQGLGIGVLVSLLFSLVPLLEVRHVKPSLLLRHDTPPRGGIDWPKWASAALVTAALIGLVVWQAGSARIGLIVCAGFAATAFVLHVAGLALVAALRPLSYTRHFALRQAVLHVVRPGSQTRVILLAVGLGSFFVIGVRGLQDNLLRQFAVQISADAPDMFLIDIQGDQVQPLTAYIDGQNDAAPRPDVIPVLRARVVGVSGREVNLDRYEDVRGRGSLAREYTITYRDRLAPNEKVIAGAWWDAAPTAKPEVSIEQSLHERFKIDVGDTVRFDVLGRTVAARVSSIRRVEWRDIRSGGFMFVFRPGPFETAPHTYIAPMIGPADRTARVRLQAGLASRFPNVSVIDLREVLETIRGIVANVTLAVTIVGAIVLLSGMLILVGAIAMTKFRRVYEAAIFRTLGASTRLIATMLVVEYGVLGLLAGAIGSLGAMALSWGVSTYALDMAWRPAPVLTVVGLLVTAVFVATVGVLASADVLRRKPLATLRAE